MTPRRAAALVTVFTVAVFGCSPDEGGEGAGQGGNVLQASTLEERSDAAANTVGSSDESGGFLFTVHQVVDPWAPARPYVTPAVGMRFVVADLTARNQGAEREVWSSALGAELLDSENRVWQTSFTALDPGMANLDGDVPPGGERRGWVSFEVPVDATLAELRLMGSITAAGAVWEL